MPWATTSSLPNEQVGCPNTSSALEISEPLTISQTALALIFLQIDCGSAREEPGGGIGTREPDRVRNHAREEGDASPEQCLVRGRLWHCGIIHRARCQVAQTTVAGHGRAPRGWFPGVSGRPACSLAGQLLFALSTDLPVVHLPH